MVPEKGRLISLFFKAVEVIAVGDDDVTLQLKHGDKLSLVDFPMYIFEEAFDRVTWTIEPHPRREGDVWETSDGNKVVIINDTKYFDMKRLMVYPLTAMDWSKADRLSTLS